MLRSIAEKAKTAKDNKDCKIVQVSFQKDRKSASENRLHKMKRMPEKEERSMPQKTEICIDAQDNQDIRRKIISSDPEKEI